jgi:two-component sensor histidine kinase/CheY-like chemotaxis protein
MGKARKQILVVEDDRLQALYLKQLLEGLGYGVPATVATGEDAVQAAARYAPGLILMDIRLRGEMDGLQAAARIRERSDIPVVFVTALSDEDTLKQIAAGQSYGFLGKPFDEKVVRLSVESALRDHEFQRQLRAGEERYRSLLDLTADGAYSCRIRADGASEVEWTAGVLAGVNTCGRADAAARSEPMLAVHPNDAARVDEWKRATIRGEEPGPMDYRLQTPSGEILWVHSRERATRDEAGARVVKVVGVMQDITSRKRTEAILAARLRMIECAATCSMDELLRATLDEAENLTGSASGFWVAVEQNQEGVQFVAWSTRTEQDCSVPDRGQHAPVATSGVWAECIRKRRAVVHNDYLHLPHRKGLPSGHWPLIRELTVPVMRGGKVVAEVGVGNKSTDYTADDVEIVSLLADLGYDLVGRMRAEEARKESEARYRDLFENAAMPTWEEDFSAVKDEFDRLRAEGVTEWRAYFDQHPAEVKRLADLIKVVDINKASVASMGVRDKAEVSRHLPDYFGEKSWPVFVEEMIALAERQTKFADDILIHSGSGKDRWFALNMSVSPGCEDTLRRVMVSFIDISDRKMAEERMVTLVAERDTLVKEVHHRVKNNFAMLASLLTLQLPYVRDPASKALLNDLQQRVIAMAKVHERLYRGGNLVRLDFDRYLHDMLAGLYHSYGRQVAAVTLTVDAQDISLEVDSAMPCALLVTELVTNTFKHAFPGGRKGRVDVTMRQSGGKVMLTVADDGVGLPPGFDLKNTFSFGLTLANTFAEQLGGTLESTAGTTSGGTRFSVVFDASGDERAAELEQAAVVSGNAESER